MNRNNLDHAAEEYSRLLLRLKSEFPDAYANAVNVSKTVLDPSQASAAEVWNITWDKPFWANARIPTAKHKYQLLKPMMSDTYRVMDDAMGPFHIEHQGSGTRVSSFEVIGASAKEITSRIRVAPHRLYAIVGAGKAIKARERMGPAPFGKLADDRIENVIDQIKREFGFGWGHISILHWLTDLGLSCKPDRHVIRSARALGLASEGGFRTPASLDAAVRVSSAVRALCQRVHGKFTPQQLREMDICMLEFSNRGLLRSE